MGSCKLRLSTPRQQQRAESTDPQSARFGATFAPARRRAAGNRLAAESLSPRRALRDLLHEAGAWGRGRAAEQDGYLRGAWILLQRHFSVAPGFGNRRTEAAGTAGPDIRHPRPRAPPGSLARPGGSKVRNGARERPATRPRQVGSENGGRPLPAGRGPCSGNRRDAMRRSAGGPECGLLALRSKERRGNGAFRGSVANLAKGRCVIRGEACSRHASALARRSCSNVMASARAHGPTPKARSTIRASPTMPPWKLKIPAWPLRSARIVSKPLIVA